MVITFPIFDRRDMASSPVPLRFALQVPDTSSRHIPAKTEMSMTFPRWGVLITLLLGGVSPVHAQATPHPIMFVTQYPIPSDFGSVGSVFANHRGTIGLVGRGGDLYIRYPDGTLRNLTREAGFGEASEMQGANSIAVRDPAVHWSGNKAIFSMVVGAPTQQFQTTEYYWQLYEVSGLAQGQTVAITRVANQPTNYNNVMPAYASDGSIVFVSDRPRDGRRHLYPQHDEYESTATPTGLWKLEPAANRLTLLQHSPSGSFNPTVDSFGRIVFTRWDHLQRDQQNDDDDAGTFNYSNEEPNAVATTDRSEVFPEPRVTIPGSTVNRFAINHFFPWQLNQDGTEEETLNHIGRHELHGYFNSSFNDDPNLREFIAVATPRTNQNSITNTLHIREDTQQAGRFVGIDAPEFTTLGSGQLVRFVAAPSTNPATMTIEYLTHPDTKNTVATPNNNGHYRNPLVLSDGRLLASHTAYQGEAGNDGTRGNPVPRYVYRLRTLSTGSNGYYGPATALTSGSGISRSIKYWDPDVLVSYSGPFWELSAVEVRARPAPPSTTETLRVPEQQAFTQEGVDAAAFRAFLQANDLAVVVMRNVTTRDAADRQQPFNLRVPGGVQTIGASGRIYDVAYMQFFQADQIRGIGGQSSPRAGRRPLAQVMHEPKAVQWNGVTPNAPAGSVRVFSDGSVAAYVPTRRAMAWHSTTPNGQAVVRERYWITFQPGEIRACDGCHGVNQANQAGGTAAQNTSLAFRDLLARWRGSQSDELFADDFE
jgi:hypothetical protein